MVDKTESFEGIEPIAIIGMDCSFPGAKTFDKYWENLANGICSISQFSTEELKRAGIDEKLLSNPNYVKANAILDDIDMFDASFFGLTAREAKTMDPQHRLLLESAWKALEHAGYDSNNYKGRIGLYAGTGMSTYLLNNLITNFSLTQDVDLDLIQQQDPISLGNDRDYLTTRISYKLGLTGPSMSINTACSTSLVAVHIASQSLLSYNCDVALAGAVSIQVPQKAGYLYREGGIASPDGTCRVFDAKAKGTLFCSGLGIVVLKRLDDAIADGDTIHAVIRGTAINNDGSLKVSFTAPSVEAQAEVVAEAQMVAGVTPDTITYVEAHGTGTIVGDPIEVAALTEAFRLGTDKKRYCALSSVKPNIGHLNRAAGMAGLIKAIMALKNKKIPPTLNYESPNPQINFENSPFFVNTILRDWQPEGIPRRAGVTSLGFGGTNAHAILEEAPEVEASEAGKPWQLIVLSAKTKTALDKATKNLAAHLKDNPEINLADVAYTLQKGRKAFNYRRVVACRNVEEAISLLDPINSKRVLSNNEEPKERSLVFMFSGQGSQYVNMAAELYENEPVFKEQIDYCCEFLKPHLNLDLRAILYPSPEKTEEAKAKLNQTSITQPALFVIEYSLSCLWQSWGIKPEAMIGHSIGEYVAATLSGVFTLDDALALVAARGKMIQELPTGIMVAVPLSEEEVQPFLTTGISLSVINGKSRCVLSGDEQAIKTLEEKLTLKGVEYRRLFTSHAFHSEMMEPIVKSFTDRVSKTTLKAPQIPYISNVTGSWITEAQATDPHYWAKHLRQTVRFSQGLEELFKTPEQILIEVGPGRTLATLASQHPDKPDDLNVLTCVRHPQDEHSDSAFILSALGKLWLGGVNIDWSLLYKEERRYRVPLPTYPFDYQKYWIEPNKAFIQALSEDLSTNTEYLQNWLYQVQWQENELKQELTTSSQPRNWLIFADKQGIGKNLAQQLQAKKDSCTLVFAADKYQQLNATEFQINPAEKSEIQQLLKQIATQPLHGVINLFSLNNSSTENVEKDSQNNCLFTLHLIQSLNCIVEKAPRVWLVTNGAVPASGGNDITGLSQAPVWGIGKVIALENPEFNCTLVDLSDKVTTEETAQLFAEICAQTKQDQVALRTNKRYVPLLMPLKVSENLTPVNVDKNGTYLITGGTGGLGLVFAKWLVDKGAKNLVLLSRSGGNPSTSSSIEQLKTAGANVTVALADVSSLEQLSKVISSINNSVAPLKGIIHAGGLIDDGVLSQLNSDSFAKVLTPKILGTWNLHNLTKELPLDFFVMFSSISSLLGNAGQANYSAANAFLDSFAYYRRANNLPALTVNWASWGSVGLAAKALVEESMARKGMELIQPQQGLEALEILLAQEATQAGVIPIDWSKYLQQFPEDSYPVLFSYLAQSQGQQKTDKAPQLKASELLAALPTLSASEGRSLIDTYLQYKIVRLLGLEPVNKLEETASLSELGIDSLTSIQLRNGLRSDLKIDLTLKQLMGETTLEQLVSFVVDQLALANLVVTESPLNEDADSDLEVIVI